MFAEPVLTLLPDTLPVLEVVLDGTPGSNMMGTLDEALKYYFKDYFVILL